MNGKSFKQLCQEIVSDGYSSLELMMGIISKIEGERYEIIAVDSLAGVFVAGEVFALNDTYCRDIVKSGKTLALTQIDGQPGLCQHPLHKNLPLHAYLGTPIYQHDKIWGTLNYSSMVIRPRPFSQAEIELVESQAQQVSAALSRLAVAA